MIYVILNSFLKVNKKKGTFKPNFILIFRTMDDVLSRSNQD